MDTPGGEEQSMHRGREQITAEPLHEQVWGWDKEAQLWLRSRTPHLANDPRSLSNASAAGCVSQTGKSEQEAVWHGSREEVSLVPTLPAWEWGLPKGRCLHAFHVSRESLEQAAGSYCSQAPLTKLSFPGWIISKQRSGTVLEPTWLKELSSFF